MRVTLHGARFLAGVLLAVTVIGCDEQPSVPSAQGSPEAEASPGASVNLAPAGCLDLPATVPAGMTRVELWFSDSTDQTAIAPSLVVHRDIEAEDAIATTTLRAWIEGPTNEEKEVGAYSSAPEGSELLGIAIEDGTAVVDLTQAFEKTGVGTTYEGAILEQLAGTITQFDTVDRTLLKIDGRFKDYYMGHGFIVDKDHPLTRPAKNRYRIAPGC